MKTCCDKFKKNNIDKWYSPLFDEFTHCPYCGTMIVKPEPEVVIKQSGGTWVARYDGVDYLCLDPEEHKAIKKNMEECENEGDIITNFKYVWKPISEIKITDDIAKLRPMVVHGTYGTFKLWGVDDSDALIENISNGDLYWRNKGVIRLATVDDLED